MADGNSFAARLARQRAGQDTGAPARGPLGELLVIGAGFGRTGTMSLKAALETLGVGPCYHMTEMAGNPGHFRLWRAAWDGEKVDWHRLYARYRATVDWPGCLYYRELTAAFPQAKVILTVRDADRWYDSVRDTLFSLKTATDAYLAGTGRRSAVQYENRIWTDTFAGRFTDRDFAIEVYRRHNQQVRDTVPAEKLLEYQVNSGWQPLCDFLQVPVPEQPFPRLNDTQAFRDYNRDALQHRP
ncbi:MAG TPA: sulfotransferase [Jatrophihabitans sp.]|nr:sulfotransferase [Jatrophihabitans sp.]